MKIGPFRGLGYGTRWLGKAVGPSAGEIFWGRDRRIARSSLSRHGRPRGHSQAAVISWDHIWAVHEGVVNTVLVGLRGLVGQLYRKDNAHKVRRGQAGCVSSKGLAGGSLAHGYAAVAGKNGERVIVNAEAEVVRRIFPDYVDGRTPREIAHDLNKERVPPPLGRAWNALTINGNRQRCAGILQNELYVGRLVRNKVRMVKDPDTGKRQSRPNSTSDWQFAEVPSLAIVSPDLFEAAQKRRRERTHTHPSHQRRPRRMLSGLLRCGACGSGMSTNGQDKSGRVRIRMLGSKGERYLRRC
jgi:site-specific DNA recombinase